MEGWTSGVRRSTVLYPAHGTCLAIALSRWGTVLGPDMQSKAFLSSQEPLAEGRAHHHREGVLSRYRHH